MAGGKFTAVDGPFPETKELIVGYAIVLTQNGRDRQLLRAKAAALRSR